MSTPPKPGARPSIRVGQDLSDDLTIIMTATGGTVSDAVRDAVRHLADAYRRAWDYGDVPVGHSPTILSVTYAEDRLQERVRRLLAAVGARVTAESDTGRPTPVRQAATSPDATAEPQRPTPRQTQAGPPADTLSDHSPSAASDSGQPPASDVRHSRRAPVGHPS